MPFPVIHKPLLSNGHRYSMHHLQPLRLAMAGQGHAGADLTVRVSFHSHVYSVGDEESSAGVRFVDEGGRWRQFSLARYEHSLELPAICAQMVERNFPTWISRDRNRTNNLAVTDALASAGFRYVVLYALSPGKADGVSVDLIVKSAFEKEVGSLRGVKKSGVRQEIKRCYYSQSDLPK